MQVIFFKFALSSAAVVLIWISPSVSLPLSSPLQSGSISLSQVTAVLQHVWHILAPSYRQQRRKKWIIVGSGAAIRLMIWLFTCPRQLLGSDTTCRDHRSLSANNVWRRDYVTSRVFGLKAAVLFGFSQICSGWHTVYTGTEETMGGREGGVAAGISIQLAS